MKFESKFLDYNLSPYTGLTRESWIEAAEYLLQGVFRNIGSYDAPVVLPRTETEITYPHKNAAENRRKMEEMAQIFEGLTRTMFIAAPLIHINPQTEIEGYNLRDYYARQILKSCTPGDENFVGYYSDLFEMDGSSDKCCAYQQTVETCALAIGLDACREEIWQRYSKEEKDIIAKFLFSYVYECTVPQNWRFFNMLGMAFLHKEGYDIDENVMLEHAQAVLNYYAGDGWYRDGQSFDYYSCWAFNVYAPIWNHWYGYEKEPYIADEFEKNSNKLMETYPDFFDRDGFTNMWGRSCIYRNAATAPFAENLMLKNSKISAGLARRIASGSLMQFMGRDDFLTDGIPTMGFYRRFSPLVQGYSCTESVYWLGKAFLCLSLPAEHPFWTEKENNGSWENLKSREVKETVLNGPALCFTNHGASGETILRTAKVIKNQGDEHGLWNYGKLCYNSKFPWESKPCDTVESMQYVITHSGEKPQRANAVLWNGRHDGILYRRGFFDYDTKCETHWMQAINLADFPVEYGIMRADKLRLYRHDLKITLGSYGFPDNGTEIIRKREGGAEAIILKGYDHMGMEKQMAMTIYDGWSGLEIIHSVNTNPDSEKSIIVYAETERRKQYGYEPFILISQVITKESHGDFAEDELFPLAGVEYTDKKQHGGYGSVKLILKNGDEKIIAFEGMEGMMMM